MTNKREFQFVDESGILYPDWEVKALNEVGEFLRGLTYKAEDVKDSGNIVLRSTNIKDGKIDMSPSILQFLSKEIPKRIQLIDGDIIICRTNGSKRLVGKSGVYRDEYNPKSNIATVGDFCSILRPTSPIANLLLQTFSYRKEIDSLLAGSAINSVKNTDIEKIKFKVPSSLREQEKIAEFFSTLDKRIALTASKAKLLHEQKTGYLQQVFNRELVFTNEDGKTYPEWEKKKLGEILLEHSEKTIKSGQHPILSSTTKGLVLQSEHFTKEVASKDNTGYKIVRSGQIVLSPQNLWLGNINYNSRFAVGIVSPSYRIFTIDAICVQEYMAYLVKTQRMLNEFANASEQGASTVRRNLNMESFNIIPVLLPSLPEQQKIAEFFSALDEQIELTENKLTLLKEQKKGYLQGIFG